MLSMRSFPEVFSIIDTETTGMRPGSARVIDIGIIRVENGIVTERYETLVNPGERVPYFITRLTGITDSMLESAPPFSDVALEVERLLSGAVFVAHNAAFDYGFMKYEFTRAGIDWSADTLCTVALSRRLDPFATSHSLDAVIDRYGIGVGDRHRALPDAEAVWEFVSSVDREVDPNVLSRLIPLREQGTRKRFPSEERTIS